MANAPKPKLWHFVSKIYFNLQKFKKYSYLWFWMLENIPKKNKEWLKNRKIISNYKTT